MNYIKVKVDDVANALEKNYRSIPYHQEDGVWFVNSENVDGKEGMRQYAGPKAKERDLRQLLLKEYDIRY